MSLALLLDLSLRGSLVLLAALLCDLIWAGKITARWRRIWWLLVPLAFLWPGSLRPPLPAHVAVYNGINSTSPVSDTAVHIDLDLNALFTIPLSPFTGPAFSWIGLVWLAGVVAGALLMILPTWKVARQWFGKRLSTDAALLNLLEDAKSTAGVAAPIGLIVSDEIAAPALLGWLRPRILLPAGWVSTSPPNELRAVLLHELAHFKSLDIPLNWLFAAVRVLHWFNPLAWVASIAWTRFREEAADETAIRWMHEPTGAAYGEILLKTLGKCTGGPAPCGALAIGESIENLKRRILMIRTYHTKSNRGWMASAVILTLGALMALSPTLAGDDNQEAAAKKDAVAAMQTWLGEIDAGSYAKSWGDSAKSFQKALTSDQWVAALNAVRTPLGKSLSRNLASALHQTGLPKPNGEMTKGDWVIAQFDSSYENLKSARETVTFEKESDGTWRAAGYFIKPQ